jgi:hypothetical protein
MLTKNRDALETRLLSIMAGTISLMAAIGTPGGEPPAAPAAAPAPFSFDAAPGRLPKNVLPLTYHVSIVPKPDDMTRSTRHCRTCGWTASR